MPVKAKTIKSGSKNYIKKVGMISVKGSGTNKTRLSCRKKTERPLELIKIRAVKGNSIVYRKMYEQEAKDIDHAMTVLAKHAR